MALQWCVSQATSAPTLGGAGPQPGSTPAAFLPRTFHPPAPVQGAPKEVVDPSSGRATLLESIRQAGGIGKAKLRSVKERKLEKKKQKEQEQGESGPAAGGRSAHVSRSCAGCPGVCGPLLPGGGACLDLANCPRKQGLGIFLEIPPLVISSFGLFFCLPVKAPRKPLTPASSVVQSPSVVVL